MASSLVWRTRPQLARYYNSTTLSGNVQDYVSQEFYAETVDEIQGTVSHIDDLWRNGSGNDEDYVSEEFPAEEMDEIEMQAVVSRRDELTRNAYNVDHVSEEFLPEAVDEMQPVVSSIDELSRNGNNEDYVSEEFLAEAVDDMQAVVSPIDELSRNGYGEDYVPEEFLGEAVVEMQPVVARIDDMNSNGSQNGENHVSGEFLGESVDEIQDAVSLIDDLSSNVSGNGEHYVSAQFLAETMDEIEDPVSRIDDLSSNGSGNGQRYVSAQFLGETMDKMQAAVSRIDGMRRNFQLHTSYQISTKLNGDYENDGIKPFAVRIGLLNWSEQDQRKEKLQEFKWYCVHQLISLHSRDLEPARTLLLLRKCLKIMIDKESEIRHFYSKGDSAIDSNSLALMMLLDGCFILHRLLKYAHVGENETGRDRHQLGRSDDNCIERLYGSPHEWELVKRDLLLFENQIPFFVLSKLLNTLDIDESELNLRKGSLQFFRSSCSHMLRSNCSESVMACDNVHHLLHLFYLSVALPDPAHVSLSIDPQWISCSKELEEAGIRFKKREKAESFLDINFDNGVVEIPPLLLDDFSKALFRSLIAFEKSYLTRQCISNYAIFMDDLMKTPEDVQILQRHGILVNMMNSIRGTSNFFNGTYIRMILPSDNYLLSHMENMMKYKDSRRHQWRADLIRSYLSNPRVAMSLLVAIMMLAASVLQSFFSVYGYYKPRNTM